MNGWLLRGERRSVKPKVYWNWAPRNELRAEGVEGEKWSPRLTLMQRDQSERNVRNKNLVVR